MREIIYVQAGELSNYTGTHFWNAQQSYFAADPADTIYDSDLSFREGPGPTGGVTYYPRLLVFDHKNKFGALSKYNTFDYANDGQLLNADSPAIWNGHVAEYRQDPIPKSAYHSISDSPDNAEHAYQSGDKREGIRYWSDFNQVHYLPRTVQKLPDPVEWDNTDGDWNRGQSAFLRHDEDHTLMDGAFRLFLEECDAPQGLHIMNDSTSFGGFISSFLTAVRDQYTKLPCFVVPFLSAGLAKQPHSDDSLEIRNVIHDALYLHSLNENASLSVPIQSTRIWPSSLWNEWLYATPEDIYHNSAIVSAMLESVTVPLRLRGSQVDLSSLSGSLNWRGNTPFSELSGIFPFKSATDFDTRLANLSAIHNSSNHYQFARFDVSRGFTSVSKSAYDSWSSRHSLDNAFLSSIHTEPYPIPTTYPGFFSNVEVTSPPRGGIPIHLEHCSLFSSLATSSQTANLFSLHASAIHSYLKKKPSMEALGFDGDDLRGLVNDLWTLHDNFDDSENGGSDDSIIGEDEAL